MFILKKIGYGSEETDFSVFQSFLFLVNITDVAITVLKIVTYCHCLAFQISSYVQISNRLTHVHMADMPAVVSSQIFNYSMNTWVRAKIFETFSNNYYFFCSVTSSCKSYHHLYILNSLLCVLFVTTTH